MSNIEILHDHLDVPLKFFCLFSSGAQNYLTFRSRKALGGWFGAWYYLSVEISLPNFIYLKDPITLRSILKQTAEVRVSRLPTGWLPFFYRHLSAETILDRRMITKI